MLTHTDVRREMIQTARTTCFLRITAAELTLADSRCSSTGGCKVIHPSSVEVHPRAVDSSGGNKHFGIVQLHSSICCAMVNGQSINVFVVAIGQCHPSISEAAWTRLRLRVQWTSFLPFLGFRNVHMELYICKWKKRTTKQDHANT